MVERTQQNVNTWIEIMLLRVVCGRVTLNKTREKERERFASTRNVNNCLFYGACNSSIHPPLLIPVKKPNDFIIIL